MSSSSIRKWVLAVAIAVMPVQGIAATLTVLICHGDAQAHATHQAAGHEHQESHSHDHGAGNDEGAATGNSYHLCCNLTASAPPSFTINTAPPHFSVQALVPDPLHDLFDPEQPQRPPLA
jgi:hypothetical protein